MVMKFEKGSRCFNMVIEGSGMLEKNGKGLRCFTNGLVCLSVHSSPSKQYFWGKIVDSR